MDSLRSTGRDWILHDWSAAGNGRAEFPVYHQLSFYTPSFSTDGYHIIDTVLINLYVCVLGPILEEVIFRGFLLKGLQRFGVSFAAVFTAILFTIYHMNLVQLFVPLIMGLFLAQLTIRTGSLIPGHLLPYPEQLLCDTDRPDYADK